MRNLKRSFSMKTTAIVLTIMSVVSVFSLTHISAFAATDGFSVISSSKPVKTHTLTKGNSIPYTNQNLNNRGTDNRKSSTAYVAGSDDLYIYKLGKNSKGIWWIYFSFPVGKTRYKAYMPLSSVTNNNGSHKKTTSTGKAWTYLRSDGSGGSSSMYIARGDVVYLISTTSSYYQIIYPCSGGYRMAWLTKSDYNKYCSGSVHTHTYTTTGYEAAHPHKVYKKCSCGSYYYTGETKKVSSCTTCYPTNSSYRPVWPCRSANYISTLYRYYNNGNPKNHGVRSNIYNAVDIAGSTGDTIYAIEKGTVKDRGYQSGGFGYYVVIQHQNGLCSLYGHLNRTASVSVGQSVSRGQTIGYMGNTGNSGGTHLHLEVYNPNNSSAVINPWVNYYQGKVSVTIGGNSYKANINYKNDSAAQAWCKWLKNNCTINSSGDYVFRK